VGSRFDDWSVCWLGGWAKHRLYYLVMLVKLQPYRQNSGDLLNAGPFRKQIGREGCAGNGEGVPRRHRNV
jgi:hypothetical protein